jgi:sugar phosphate isomerase/epimerase
MAHLRLGNQQTRRKVGRMNRRSFLWQTAAATSWIWAGQAAAAEEAMAKYRKNIGLQLYTLRNPLGQDLTATMKAVAEAGYGQVELYGFPDSELMMKAARDVGLMVQSTHFAWDSVVSPSDASYSDFAKILDQAHERGLKHLVVPYLHDGQRKNLSDYQKVAAHLSAAAAMSAKAGIRLAYHNHNFEFAPMENGRTGYDVLMQECSEQVCFELDVFWVAAAGLDPVALMKKLKGRVTQLHLKDLKKGIAVPTYNSQVPADAFQELGDGIIAMKPLIEAAAVVGVEHCHIEQDQSPDPLASVRQSIRYWQSI